MQATEQSAVLEDAKLAAARIFGLIAPELKLVEEEFARQARSNVQVIEYLGDYLRAFGWQACAAGTYTYFQIMRSAATARATTRFAWRR